MKIERGRPPVFCINDSSVFVPNGNGKWEWERKGAKWRWILQYFVTVRKQMKAGGKRKHPYLPCLPSYETSSNVKILFPAGTKTLRGFP
ncbi:hypothetical protein TNCT_167431 [Trichonephila clavata]|uniref:Uncharacterized protein n=1 Tax=Trichonephila clavata TaxID=2740835 RepID=A0A8X6LMU5_TRICU|nr:hypothetical protein TNCT_167431 [Trichonephila clavata]